MPDWKTYKGQTPWENPVMRKKTSYNEGALIADSRNPVWQYPEWRTTPVTNKHLPCGYWDAKQSAMVVFNITHPVGYDTWTCDGVVYNGKITTHGPGMMYEGLTNFGTAYGINNLHLIYPRIYGYQDIGIATPSAASPAGPFPITHIRGVGNIEDIVVLAGIPLLTGNDAFTVTEGITLQQSVKGGHNWPPVSTGSRANDTFNKLITIQATTQSTIMYGVLSRIGVKYCTLNASASSTKGTIYSYWAANDNTLSYLVSSYVPNYQGLYGGTGVFSSEDYSETPSAGYGSDYGSYLVTDWEFDGTKRKLSYEGGTAVDVSAGGYFTLTNTKREFINVYVEAASLPSVDRTLTIYNDRYTDGIKII
jgi:hypothetical protein